MGSATALTIQLEADARAAAEARIGKGEYSAGRSQGIARRPTAKKKLSVQLRHMERDETVCAHLKRKSIVAATIPVA
jgi:hypothetical protein